MGKRGINPVAFETTAPTPTDNDGIMVCGLLVCPGAAPNSVAAMRRPRAASLCACV